MLLYGALTFFISQIVLRLPLLNILMTQSFFLPIRVDALLYLGFLAVSAGLFEESARWIAFRFCKQTPTFSDALLFGLGHGGIEALLLVGLPALFQPMSMELALWSGWERTMAMIAHCCFTLIIWQGILSHQKRYLLGAILAHAAFDFLPIFIGGSAIVAVEGWITGCTLVFVVIVYFFIIKKSKTIQIEEVK